MAFLAACGDPTNPPTRDGGRDGGIINDGGRDTSVGDGGVNPGGPVITRCAGDSIPSLASGTCAVTAPRGRALLITADVLTPGEVFRGGQVLVDANGTITCTGCDCAAQAASANATELSCPDGVISPGLINAHEHLTYQGHPYTRTDERYEHRHEWRRGSNGHTEIPGPGNATTAAKQWAELRMVMGGATALNGSGSQAGFLRNLDKNSAAQEGLGQSPVVYQTFPLDDSSGRLLESGCGYGNNRDKASDIAQDDAYTPHLSEGISTAARNEFLCVREGDFDLIQRQTGVIHGVGLLPGDISEFANDGAKLIWSPRSNVTLYGDTARVTEYARLGVSIALGTDWVFTGSMNMLRELACADSLNANYYDSYFTDEQLWLMATRNSAIATGTDDAIGTISPNHIADLAIFNGKLHPDHRAVLDAEPEDVVLVLRSGVPLYGDSDLVNALVPADNCDAVTVCGTMKRACTTREVGTSFSDLEMANMANYELFFCDNAVENEPSCLPARNGANASVNGSSVYTGMSGAEDLDGDGIANASDNCPNVFNPVRPMDNGRQADTDNDMVGDACDPCALEPNTNTCSGPDPNDRDRDGVANDVDNCPEISNPDQADTDNDMIGNLCDACPEQANPGGTACTVSIYAIKQNMVMANARIRVVGTVTAIGPKGFYMQVGATQTGYTGVDFSGVYVYTATAPTINVGQVADVQGQVADFFGQKQVTNVMVTVAGDAALPEFASVTSAEIQTGGARAAALEGALVRIQNATVSNNMPTALGGDPAVGREIEVNSGLRVDDALFAIEPLPATGAVFTEIRGVLNFSYANSKLLPRSAADFIQGPPALAAIEPANAFIRVDNTAGDTFPQALTVRLNRTAEVDTTITLSSSATGLAVSNTVIPAGSDRATVVATPSIASTTPYVVTASLDGQMFTANVRVLGATEGPTVVTANPSTLSLYAGQRQTIVLTLDVPAPAAGLTVQIADSTGSTVPASITFAANSVTASFEFIAGEAAISGAVTLTGVGSGTMIPTTIVDGAPGSVVINEIDYDQPSTDTAEFVELYNPGTTSADLTNLAVWLINGSNNQTVGNAALTGTLAPGAYLVIGITGQTISIPAAATRINFSAANSIQNDTEAVLIVNTATMTVVDALSYGGTVTANIFGSPRPAYEGENVTPWPLRDSTAMSAQQSVCRVPNGSDSNRNTVDFAICMPTPGAANAALPTT